MQSGLVIQQVSICPKHNRACIKQCPYPYCPAPYQCRECNEKCPIEHEVWINYKHFPEFDYQLYENRCRGEINETDRQIFDFINYLEPTIIYQENPKIIEEQVFEDFQYLEIYRNSECQVEFKSVLSFLSQYHLFHEMEEQLENNDGEEEMELNSSDQSNSLDPPYHLNVNSVCEEISEQAHLLFLCDIDSRNKGFTHCLNYE